MHCKVRITYPLAPFATIAQTISQMWRGLTMLEKAKYKAHAAALQKVEIERMVRLIGLLSLFFLFFFLFFCFYFFFFLPILPKTSFCFFKLFLFVILLSHSKYKTVSLTYYCFFFFLLHLLE